MSYIEDRLKILHITDKINTYKATDIDGHSINFKFFTETDKGDISINYIGLDGVVEVYETENRKIRSFSRTRFQVPKGDMKYGQPSGSPVLPFITPEILKRYKKSEETETLYIVEGEFKAFAMSNFGLPTIGIGGIHNYKSNKKDDIHPYILDFCHRCKVKNIVLLFDADCLKVEWKEDKELTTRLSGFYTALNKFNEYLKPHNLTLYFSHIVADSKYKGIDDVLYGGSDQKLVISELEGLLTGTNERKYILTYLITGTSPFQIQRIFGLDSVKTFYELNIEILKNKEFIYKGNPYYADENGKLAVSWKGQQKNYVRIGVDYYKKIVEKAPNGQTEINIIKWSKENIRQDFHNSKEFINMIEKCDAFTNVPENDPNKYKQIIVSEKDGITSRLYNRYSPIYHIPAEGSWRTINKLLHHIFDYKNVAGESLYDFALDYIQLLYTQPVKHLPILCLVSKERGTGKTTFLNLLRAIFIENMRILDSERLMSKFNGHWAGKLIVSVDESFINMDEKNGAGNKLKMIATNATIPCEGKGKDSTEVPNISKLILCSNDEYNFVKIDMEENRYCIIKVNPIEETKDPHMFDRMVEEIPAFLYFLKNRQLYYPEKSRLWFDERIFETEALNKIKERTENTSIKNIKEVIKEQFFIQEAAQIKLSAKVIFELVKEQYRFITPLMIKEWLKDNGYRVSTATTFQYKYSYDCVEFMNAKDRCYTFHINQFLSPEEMEELDKGLSENK
ncbi:MAG: DUF3854 domain-containing protein [Bacteroidales bacterium]|nr:DUF3854 domain-containing protein [Bacteroidales bacterium]